MSEISLLNGITEGFQAAAKTDEALYKAIEAQNKIILELCQHLNTLVSRVGDLEKLIGERN